MLGDHICMSKIEIFSKETKDKIIRAINVLPLSPRSDRRFEVLDGFFKLESIFGGDNVTLVCVKSEYTKQIYLFDYDSLDI